MEMSTNENVYDDEMIDPDILFDQIFALNSNTALEDKIIKRVEQMLTAKNTKIVELEEKIDKLIHFNEEIIRTKEIEISILKDNLNELKKLAKKFLN